MTSPSSPSSPGGGVVDMTCDDDIATAEPMAIDLTGPDTAAATAPSSPDRRQRSFTLALGGDADDSSAPASSGAQDARFPNFTPARRTPKPSSRRRGPPAATAAAAAATATAAATAATAATAARGRGEVGAVGGSSSGWSSRAPAPGPGGRGQAIDLSSDNDEGGGAGAGSSSTQAEEAGAAEGAKGAPSDSSKNDSAAKVGNAGDIQTSIVAAPNSSGDVESGGGSGSSIGVGLVEDEVDFPDTDPTPDLAPDFGPDDVDPVADHHPPASIAGEKDVVSPTASMIPSPATAAPTTAVPITPSPAAGKTPDPARATAAAAAAAAATPASPATASWKVSSAYVAFSAARGGPSASSAPPPRPPPPPASVPSPTAGKSGQDPADDKKASGNYSSVVEAGPKNGERAAVDGVSASNDGGASGAADESGTRAEAAPVAKEGEEEGEGAEKGEGSGEATRDSAATAAATDKNVAPPPPAAAAAAAAALPAPSVPAAAGQVVRSPDNTAGERGSCSKGTEASGCGVTSGVETGVTAAAGAATAKDGAPNCVARLTAEDSITGEPRPVEETGAVVGAGSARDGASAAATTIEAVQSTSAVGGEAGKRSDSSAEAASSRIVCIGPVVVAIRSTVNGPPGGEEAVPAAEAAAAKAAAAKAAAAKAAAAAEAAAPVPSPTASGAISDKASDGTSVFVGAGSVESPVDDGSGRVKVGSLQPSGQPGAPAAGGSTPAVDGARTGGCAAGAGAEKAAEATEKELETETAAASAGPTIAGVPSKSAPAAAVCPGTEEKPTTADTKAAASVPTAPTAAMAAVSGGSGGSRVPTPPAGAAAAPAPSGSQTPPAQTPAPKTGTTKRQRGKEKTTCLYLHVIGPAPTEDKVPPARRVQLTSRHDPPVGLETRIEKPGTYTLYVTASMRWTGSGPCADPSETPIRLMQFRVPESLYANQSSDLNCGKCGEALGVRRIINKDPLGTGKPLELRLVPRTGLSFLADLSVHAYVPPKLPRCRVCVKSRTEPPPSTPYIPLTEAQVTRAVLQKAVNSTAADAAATAAAATAVSNKTVSIHDALGLPKATGGGAPSAVAASPAERSATPGDMAGRAARGATRAASPMSGTVYAAVYAAAAHAGAGCEVESGNDDSGADSEHQGRATAVTSPQQTPFHEPFTAADGADTPAPAAADERVATTNDGAAATAKLDSFRHALELLTKAIDVAVKNKEVGTRKILEPVFGRLGDAIAAMRSSGAADQAAFELLQRDCEAGREKLRRDLPLPLSPEPAADGGPPLAQGCGGGAAGAGSYGIVGGGGGFGAEGGNVDEAARQDVPSEVPGGLAHRTGNVEDVPRHESGASRAVAEPAPALVRHEVSTAEDREGADLPQDAPPSPLGATQQQKIVDQSPSLGVDAGQPHVEAPVSAPDNQTAPSETPACLVKEARTAAAVDDPVLYAGLEFASWLAQPSRQREAVVAGADGAGVAEQQEERAAAVDQQKAGEERQEALSPPAADVAAGQKEAAAKRPAAVEAAAAVARDRWNAVVAAPGTPLVPVTDKFQSQMRAALAQSMWRGYWADGSSSPPNSKIAGRVAVAAGDAGRLGGTETQRQQGPNAGGAVPCRASPLEVAAFQQYSFSRNADPSPAGGGGRWPPPEQSAAAAAPASTPTMLSSPPPATSPRPNLLGKRKMPSPDAAAHTRAPSPPKVSSRSDRPMPAGNASSAAQPECVSGGPSLEGRTAQVGLAELPAPHSGNAASAAAPVTLQSQSTNAVPAQGAAGGAQTRERELEKQREQERARVARREELRRSVMRAEHLHIQFRSFGGPDAGNRGNNERSRLYLLDGDPLLPDNKPRGAIPRGLPLPNDGLFPQLARQLRLARTQTSTDVSRKQPQQPPQDQGGGIAQPKFTGEWRD
eukprot:g16929.t1